MSDNHDYLRTGAGSFRLRADILALMMKGAGYGLIFCLGLWLCIAVIAGIGKLLPDASRDTPDPTPWSHMIAPAETPDHRAV